MNHNFPVVPLVAALVAIPLIAQAAPAGTLLFTKGDLQIIDAGGISRLGKAGDILQPGERVVTLDGAVCQIRLWDGSLIGVRPDTELKVVLPDQASARAKSVIQVVSGALRVINVDLRDGKVRVPITVHSPNGIVDLTNADAESRVVSPEGMQKAGVKDAGLYTRVQVGKAMIRTAGVDVPIAPRTVAFLPKIDAAPTVVRSTGTALFTTALLTPTLAPKLATTIDPKLTTTLEPKLAATMLEPKLTTTVSLTTSTLTSPTLATSLTSPTLITKLSSPTLSTTFTSPTLATASYTSPTTTNTVTRLPTISTSYIAPTTYTAPTTTTTLVSTTTLISPTLTKTSTLSGTTTTFTTKTGGTLTLR